MTSLQKALAQSQDDGLGNGSETKQKTKTFTPVIRTVQSSDDEDDDDDDSTASSEEEQTEQEETHDMIKIRQQAVDLLNTPSAGPNAAASPQNYKQTYEFPQQRQSAGEAPSYSYQASSHPYAMHNPESHPRAHVAPELSVTDMLVNCVSEVCKSSSSELIHKVLSAGYKSVSNYGDPPLHGDWGDSIDTSQHGYGNGNRSSFNSGTVGTNMPSRYQD